jgi:predicted helicase
LKQLFTIHAGEFLVANEIEHKFRRANVWIPAKDTGIDLLVSNSDNTKTVSLQVKFSRDYLVTNLKDAVFQRAACCSDTAPGFASLLLLEGNPFKLLARCKLG